MSKIYIDIGHGTTGEDSGTSGTLKGVVYNENECNLRIAIAVRDALVKTGHIVALSRAENKNITAKIGTYGQADSNLIASANRVKTGDYDLMISIHNNSSTNTAAKGHQLFYKVSNGREAESKKLAEAISGALAAVVVKNSVSGSDYYGILRLHDKIGVLCECAFMSNSADLAIITSKYAEIGTKIAEGVNRYLGVKSSETKQETTQWYRVRKTWADAESQIGAYEVLENAKRTADQNPGYYVFDESGTVVYPTEKDVGTQSPFASLSEAEVVAKVGPLFTTEQERTGILASVAMAQFILESGYGKTELAQKANNYFGMKCSLSGNIWSGSTWDGVSKYTKETQEQNTDGTIVTIAADFRKYPCVEDSIADHSAYLLGSKDGAKFRYDGLAGCADYKKAAQIIKDGGYATDLNYVSKLCNIIEQWNLTQFDILTEPDYKTLYDQLMAEHVELKEKVAKAAELLK